jgi:predicted flap endonuclease-1-like 5' DNA nuclease
MMTLAVGSVLWAVIGLAAGWLIAWFWRSRMMRDSVSMLQAEARAKYEQLKRDLEGRVARVENDLMNAKEVIQARDVAIAERDRLIRQQNEQLTDGNNQIARLTVASTDRQARLNKQEVLHATLEQEHRAVRARIEEQQKRIADDNARLAELEPLPAKLAASNEKLVQTTKNLDAANARFNSQDLEISRLHKRTVELEPLTIAVKDREAKLAEVEARLAEAVRVRDAQIAQLAKRVAELEPLQQRLIDGEEKRTRLAGELDVLRLGKDREIEALQQELKAIDVLRRQIAERDASTLRLREQQTIAVRDSDLRRAAIAAELALARDERAQRDRSLDENASIIAQLQQQLAPLVSLPDVLREKDQQIRRIEQQLAEALQRAGTSDQTLREREREMEKQARRLRAQVTQFEPLIEGVAAHSARVLELERGIAQREYRLRNESRQIEELRGELLAWLRLAGALPSRAAEIARLRARLQAGESAPSPIKSKPNSKDDLKRILGIGPVLERMLHKEGVMTFKQIARWNEADVNAIAGKLGAFSNRIVRDNWVAQAKAYHLDKYGESADA